MATPDEDRLVSLLSTIQEYASNADAYSIQKPGWEDLKEELESIIEDATEALAIVSEA